MIAKTGDNHPVVAVLAAVPTAEPISWSTPMRFSNEFGFCDLNEFPGCSQLVVSNHAFVYEEHRGKGHGDENHKKRVLRVKNLGYDAMICTVRADNEPQIAIMKKNGWKMVHTFFNKVTKKDIQIWVRNLEDKK